MIRRRLRLLPGVALMALAACAPAPPAPGTTVHEARFAEAAIPGASTKASLLAALGPTRKVAFDSGYEAWLYTVPAGGGRFVELVVLIGPDGIVRKTRRRDP
jgi:hypothetical protein